MKLNKLVYYAQGFHFALHDAPLSKETIEAWTHGPVIPYVYHAFKENGASCIPVSQLPDVDPFTAEQRELLYEIYEAYGQFSAWKLRNMTHDEPPWQEVVDNNLPIQHSTLKSYFKTQLVDG